VDARVGHGHDVGDVERAADGRRVGGQRLEVDVASRRHDDDKLALLCKRVF